MARRHTIAPAWWVGIAGAVALAALGSTAELAGAQAPLTSRLATIRVYLDCHGACDEADVRSTIRIVHYVWDVRNADVHVLVSTERTGSGGTAVDIVFLGYHAFSGVNDTLHYATAAGATADSTERAFRSAFLMGLVRYVEHTPAGAALRIAFGPPSAETVSSGVPRDPWHNWIFSVHGSGSASGQQTSHELDLLGRATASQTTANWKVLLSGATATSLSSYAVDSATLRSSVAAAGLGGYIVRSVGPHWSVGFEGADVASTYLNEKEALHWAPAVEYDLFPYAESTRRQCTVTYTVGGEEYQYHTMTVYGKLGELRPQETLQVAFGAKEPWGTVGVSIDGANYLDDLTENHLTSAASASLHVAGGLDLTMSAQFGVLHDQLYLPAGAASTDAILLHQLQQGTGYEYGMSLGLTFRFGSLFNDIVNPRLIAGTPDLTPGL